MAEIDSLNIEIIADVDKASAALDELIKKMGTLAERISSMGKISGLQELAKNAQELTKGFADAGKAMSASMKPVQEEAKKIAKTFEQVAAPLKDLGKGFHIEGGVSELEKGIKKYTNELEKAKLKEQELAAKGNTNTKGYQNAVADVVKYQNVLESLKGQLAELSNAKVAEKTISPISKQETINRKYTMSIQFRPVTLCCISPTLPVQYIP